MHGLNKSLSFYIPSCRMHVVCNAFCRRLVSQTASIVVFVDLTCTMCNCFLKIFFLWVFRRLLLVVFIQCYLHFGIGGHVQRTSATKNIQSVSMLAASPRITQEYIQSIRLLLKEPDIMNLKQYEFLTGWICSNKRRIEVKCLFQNVI